MINQQKALKNSTGSASFAYLLVLLMAGVIGYLAWQLYLPKPEPKAPVETVSHEAVVKQIQQLSRLQTITYNVDTVISSEKQGTWQALWQDKQKALFIAHGNVQAGIDLAEISTDMVLIEFSETETNKTIENAKITINLPPAKLFEVYLDNIEMYDWQTGMFGIVQADPDMLSNAQRVGKQKVLQKACQSGILQQASTSALQQVNQLFALTGASVHVNIGKPAQCDMTALPKMASANI